MTTPINNSISPFLSVQSHALHQKSSSKFLDFFKGAKNSIKTLATWSERKNHQVLVHSVRYGQGQLFEESAEKVFATWDVMSTSLVNVKNISKFRKSLAAWEDQNRRTGAFDTVSFVTDVPPQNVIGTHPKDVWFPNHAGVKNGKVMNSYALVDAINSGKRKDGKYLKGGFKRLMSPKKLLRESASHHNEVLVIGRKDISVYEGMKPTQPITIREILVARQTKYGGGVFERAANADAAKIVEKLQKLNPGIPVKVIK